MSDVQFIFLFKVEYNVKFFGNTFNQTSTHKWDFSLLPLNNCVLDYVKFILHESFQNHIRKFTKPPYVIQESGYGTFDMIININLFGKIYTEIYPIVLYNDPPVNHKIDYFVLSNKIKPYNFPTALRNGGIPVPDSINIRQLKLDLLENGPGVLPQHKFQDIFNYVKHSTVTTLERATNIQKSATKKVNNIALEDKECKKHTSDLLGKKPVKSSNLDFDNNLDPMHRILTKSKVLNKDDIGSRPEKYNDSLEEQKLKLKLTESIFGENERERKTNRKRNHDTIDSDVDSNRKSDWKMSKLSSNNIKVEPNLLEKELINRTHFEKFQDCNIEVMKRSQPPTSLTDSSKSNARHHGSLMENHNQSNAISSTSAVTKERKISNKYDHILKKKPKNPNESIEEKKIVFDQGDCQKPMKPDEISKMQSAQVYDRISLPEIEKESKTSDFVDFKIKKKNFEILSNGEPIKKKTPITVTNNCINSVNSVLELKNKEERIEDGNNIKKPLKKTSPNQVQADIISDKSKPSEDHILHNIKIPRKLKDIDKTTPKRCKDTDSDKIDNSSQFPKILKRPHSEIGGQLEKQNLNRENKSVIRKRNHSQSSFNSSPKRKKLVNLSVKYERNANEKSSSYENHTKERKSMNYRDHRETCSLQLSESVTDQVLSFSDKLNKDILDNQLAEKQTLPMDYRKCQTNEGNMTEIKGDLLELNSLHKNSNLNHDGGIADILGIVNNNMEPVALTVEELVKTNEIVNESQSFKVIEVKDYNETKIETTEIKNEINLSEPSKEIVTFFNSPVFVPLQVEGEMGSEFVDPTRATVMSLIERIRLREELTKIEDESFYKKLHNLICVSLCNLEEGLTYYGQSIGFDLTLISNYLAQNIRNLVDSFYTNREHFNF